MTQRRMSEASPAAGSSGRQSELAENNIRGSTLLLSGRALSLTLTLNFVAQVITVRYLSTLDYGVFAFAFALSEYLAILVAFGMENTIARFAPIYHERGDHSRLLGAVLLAIGSILAGGISLVLLVFGLRAPIEAALDFNAVSFYVLVALILITPLSVTGRFKTSHRWALQKRPVSG